MPGPYATSDDLGEYWRTLSDAEQSRADVLLGAAGDLIDEQPGAADFVPTALKWVSLDMVKRAMIGGGGASSGSQSMADMSVTVQYVNPVGNLYLTRQELQRLVGPTPPTASITPTSNVRVPQTFWNIQPSSQT
jgi:hypothetical protein